MATDALAVSDVDTCYGDRHVLHGVSFSLQPGRLLGLLGRNGAGRTTCMSTTCVFSRRGGARSGFSANLIAVAPDVIARKGICLVPQGRRMFRTLTVRETCWWRRKAAQLATAQPGRSIGYSGCFLASRSAMARSQARSRAESSRCWQSDGHSWAIHACS